MFQFKWVWANLKKRHLFVIGMILSAVTCCLIIVNPMLSQRLIDEVITPQSTERLLPLLGLMLAVQATRLTLRYLMVMCLETSSQTMLDAVRRHLYEVIQNGDHRFFARLRTGDLMTRMTNDLDMIRHSVAWVSYNIVDSVVLFAVTIIYFSTVDGLMTLCLAAITPVILLVSHLFSRIIRPKYITLREKLSRMSTAAQENIDGNRVVKAFAQEEQEKRKFNERNEDYRNTNLVAVRVGVKFQPVIEALSQSLTITALLVGGLFMIEGRITAGEMLAFSSLTWALAMPLKNLGMLINDIQRFFASCNMVIELFYAQPHSLDLRKSAPVSGRLRGEVEYKNVSLKLDGEELLKDISFHIEPGKTLGIMGTTGSGKTTLINMLLRFFDPTQGQVLLDGHTLKHLTLTDLRTSIGLAMQDVFLFSDTVAANIAYGNADLSDEEIIQCAKAAGAHDFIMKMSDGYDTLVGERGVGLSGGQKQRISLARALAMQPSVLILDDTTSALDMETEQYIQKELRKLPFECTKIIIAQRISSVKHAEEIIVLDGGRIAERGTHDELLAKRGFYYRIWSLQNGTKEADEIGA